MKSSMKSSSESCNVGTCVYVYVRGFNMQKLCTKLNCLSLSRLTSSSLSDFVEDLLLPGLKTTSLGGPEWHPASPVAHPPPPPNTSFGLTHSSTVGEQSPRLGSC